MLHTQLARMVSALQQQQQQQQQQRQPSMKHSPSHPVGPKPHLDNMVPNALNVGLPDLQTKGPISGYGSGMLFVVKSTNLKICLSTLAPGAHTCNPSCQEAEIRRIMIVVRSHTKKNKNSLKLGK
jgi:hypothetical protein